MLQAEGHTSDGARALMKAGALQTERKRDEQEAGEVGVTLETLVLAKESDAGPSQATTSVQTGLGTADPSTTEHRYDLTVGMQPVPMLLQPDLVDQSHCHSTLDEVKEYFDGSSCCGRVCLLGGDARTMVENLKQSPSKCIMWCGIGENLCSEENQLFVSTSLPEKLPL